MEKRKIGICCPISIYQPNIIWIYLSILFHFTYVYVYISSSYFINIYQFDITWQGGKENRNLWSNIHSIHICLFYLIFTYWTASWQNLTVIRKKDTITQMWTNATSKVLVRKCKLEWKHPNLSEMKWVFFWWYTKCKMHLRRPKVNKYHRSSFIIC